MIQSSAQFSPDRVYRYRLDRKWNSAGKVINFILLNPSTATENVNDPTVSRCQTRAMLMEFGSLTVTNLFAFRSTDPEGLKTVADPVGAGNDEAILTAAAEADLVVCGWGAKGSWFGREAHVLELLSRSGQALHCLQLTNGGHPKHPLYIRFNDLPVPFIPRGQEHTAV